jgi:hypothetical protein
MVSLKTFKHAFLSDLEGKRGGVATFYPPYYGGVALKYFLRRLVADDWA